jgi:predicted dienelactone hydrolase
MWPGHLPTMNIDRRTLLAGLAAGPAAAATPASPLPDLLQDWTDAARRRRVPVRIRQPGGTGPVPVVILSHGLGGSRDGLGYLGIALVEAGFLVIHVQHLGTDTAVWRGQAQPVLAMAAAVLDIRHAMDRLHDIAFVLDRLQQPPATLATRPDLSRIAIAGHSYGAWTVTHMLGERLPPFGLAALGLLDANPGPRLPDPRLRAGVALSPVPPLGIRAADAFDRVVAPILHITGTRDHGVVEAADPKERQIPYRSIAAPGVLAVLDGATHAAFAGEKLAGSRFDDPTYQPRTARLAVLFLRATLLGDGIAAALVQRGAMLSPGDRIEYRGRLA